MSQPTDLESEQFMTLLTDALRAGPGSPEWHQAVGTLRASGAANADEFQMLVRAREDLESGRDYRAVTPGAGFTRKVLQGIEEEAGDKSKGLPSANLIAILAALVILAVVAVVAVSLMRNGPAATDDGAAVEQLRGVYFINPLAKLNFADAAAEIGPEWKTVGEVPLKVNKSQGLGPATTQATKGADREYKAGAIVLAEPVAPDQARMLDVTLRATKATDAIIPEVFVAEGSPGEDGQPAGGAHEMVWQLKGGAARVALADGKVPVQGEKIDPKRTPNVNVKVRFDKDTVIVESDDKRLYEGPHRLSESQPRYVGVRFRRKVGEQTDGVWLSGINVTKP